MIELNKRNMKEVPIGCKIHVVGNDLNVRGTVNRIDENGVGITCSENIRVGLFFNSVNKYTFELI